MRIAGEIVNSRSAAADLTQSRSTRSATRRLDTKAGDSYCSLSPARPFGVRRQTLTLCEELPKKRRRTEVFVLPIGSHGAYRQAHSQISTFGSYVGRHRHPHYAYPRASGPGVLAIGPIIARSKRNARAGSRPGQQCRISPQGA